MKLLNILIGILATLILISCNGKEGMTDATGVFEATEIIVSAETQGKLITFNIMEGDQLKKGQVIGLVDTVQLHLTKNQLVANKKALMASKPNISTQIEATENEISHLTTEKHRVENLIAGNAATQKQLDDINSQLKVLKSKLKAQKSSLNINVNSLDAQIIGLKAQIEKIEDQINKSIIKSPIDGTVLVKYAEESELTAPGKALFKIADVNNMKLKAYVTSGQLAELKIGEEVKVYAEFGAEENREYDGKIIWVSDKAEFTPKTIQTQDERANLVYAVKILVPNDELLKIGMYGGFKFLD